MGRGNSKAGYGKEFKTLHQTGNIKFVQYNGKSSTSPQITKTSGRVYAVVNSKNTLKSIVYFDKNNKRTKTIDLDHAHDDVRPHGYNHKENDSSKGYANLTPKEKSMVERVEKEWYNYQNR